MGLETVIEDVLARGRSEAEEIRRATAEERERILRDARAEGAKLLAQREQEAKGAAERVRIQALARAELESKKIVLSAQKELLDQVYATSLRARAWSSPSFGRTKRSGGTGRYTATRTTRMGCDRSWARVSPGRSTASGES